MLRCAGLSDLPGIQDQAPSLCEDTKICPFRRLATPLKLRMLRESRAGREDALLVRKL